MPFLRRCFVSFSIVTLFAVLVAAAPAAKPFAGFSCMTLAHRQSLPGAPGETFRVLKQTYSPAFAPVRHRHEFGEILYLLSGSATDTTNGRKTILTGDRAIVIPAETYHDITPGPNGAVLLDIQFLDRNPKTPGWEPKVYKAPELCKD
jgi:quercetin dioxygenase-like cupin family protein